MKKEVLIAIFMGLSLGLIVSYGIYTARRSLRNLPNQKLAQNASPGIDEMVHNSLALISPEDESVYATPQVEITGTTDPESLIVSFVNNKEQITTADNSGNFSFQSTLESGANTILVRAIDEDGNIAELERTVIFSTVPFEEVATASATPSPSPKTTPRPTPKPSPSPKTL